jgi:hypothetical protein
MPLTGCRGILQATSMHGEERMAMNGQILGERGGSPWRFVGWGIAATLLLLPLIAMQFTPEVNWTAEDFIVWGIMLGTVGGLFELAVRISPLPSYRAAFGLALLGAFLTTWANLAVGIVGSENNAANQLFFLALLIGIVTSGIARLKAAGMAVAMLTTAITIVLAFLIAEARPTDEPWVHLMAEAIGTGIFVLLFVSSAALFRRAAHSSSTV